VITNLLFQLNNSLINKRIGAEDGGKRFEEYKWIIPFNYESNLEDFGETFILNRTHCKYNNQNMYPNTILLFILP
jgi:hypothetical protein